MNDTNEDIALDRILGDEFNSPKVIIVNEESYASSDKSTVFPTISLSVEAILNTVPGAFYDPEDLMKWIASHPYVRSVTLESNSRDTQEQSPESSISQIVESVLSGDEDVAEQDPYDAGLEHDIEVDQDQRKEAAETNSLILEVGKKYLSGEGLVVTILHTEPNDPDQHEGLQYIGDDDWSYSVTGRWSWEADSDSVMDLVSLVEDPEDA